MGDSFVYIDYQHLADHMVSRYDVDNPSPLGRFGQFRAVLENQLEMLISPDPFVTDEDEELTELLLEHYTCGSIQSIHLTTKPAIVVSSKSGCIALPLIIIKLE